MEQVEASYQEALDYIYRFVDYSLTRSFRFSPEKFDLKRMHNLLALMGNPHQQFLCIHVAGTKGKGSVCALIANTLKTAGHHTGLYTSPHLQDYCERIQINGKPIAHGEFVKLVDEIKPYVAQIEQLTTFEISTALAFLYFAKNKVGIAVIEVGLGGRLDATNVIDPLVSVITSISYDHMDILGNTLTQIAGEKAGIIKNGRPVIISTQKDEANLVFKKTAQERNSPFFPVEEIYEYEPLNHSLNSQAFFIHKKSDPQDRKILLSIPLLGEHQIENAVTAFAVIKYLKEEGISISDEAVHMGFETVFWPARFEVLKKEAPIIIIDSAHNRDSAMRLRETLDDYLPGKPVILVFGASEDKDIDGMLDELSPRISQVVATRSIHPRAMSLDTIMETAGKYRIPARKEETVEAALKYAMETASETAVILVAGSLFVSAAARDVGIKMGMPLRSY
jgi:dihydrofolate synthase / folylpolyglutamate synthase